MKRFGKRSRHPRARRFRRRIRRPRRFNPGRHIANRIHKFKVDCPLQSSFASLKWGYAAGPAGQGNDLNPLADGWAYDTGTGSVSNFSYVALGIPTMLSNIAAITNFGNLFDRYMITGVCFKLTPYSTTVLSADVQTGAHQAPAMMVHSIIDYDNSNVSSTTASATGIAAFKSNWSYRYKNIFDQRRPGFKRFWRPRTLGTLFNGTAGEQVVSNRRQWVSVAGSDIQLYGMKMIFEVFAPLPGLSSSMWFQPSMTVYFKLRDCSAPIP